MSQYLPLDILRHLFTRTVVSAILEQFHSGKDKVAELGMMMDPQWRELLSGIIANKQKMLSAREATSLDAAKDLLRKVWIDQCQRARDNLDAQAKESDTTRLLDTTKHPFMPSVVRKGAGHGTTAGAATSSHEEDSASGAHGSDEFRPSELPPDEMLD
jgi:hypothetical protein